jgi:2-polyprenyl-6-methoxyphenol hydroxylase-like FAD-dependent oxidoreductase
MPATADSPQIPGEPVASGKKIIIIGAGISGLAFALALRKTWPKEYGDDYPSVIIYERDGKEPSAGREGYSISIRGDPAGRGMQVLQKLDLLESMLPVSAAGTRQSAFTLWNMNWVPLWEMSGEVATDDDLPAPAIRIARALLRQIMIDAIDEQDAIHWETPCTKVELSQENGRVSAYLGNGDVDECDLLIVADGANSKIRNQLRPTDNLSFRGVVGISGTSRFPEGTVPKPIDRSWGRVLGGGGVGLFMSPVDDKSGLWNLSYLTDQQRERIRHPIPEDQAQSLVQEVLERGKCFTEPFPTMVKATDPTTLMIFNAMDKQPFGHDAHLPAIFLGDSNHAMSPFAGNGANMALRDGWDLAEQLSKSGSLASVLKAYDCLSIPRSSGAIRQSHWKISLFHATGLKLIVYKLFLMLRNLCMRFKK